ncbi:MAG TPA: hypothetical protein VEA17_09730 [Bordetella sp.]|nr:hypothetical protein [Bordetella sp.]
MINRYSLCLSNKWTPTILASAEEVESMRRDGYVIDELLNRVPQWLPSPLVRPWCWVQDGWRWLRVF